MGMSNKKEHSKMGSGGDLHCRMSLVRPHRFLKNGRIQFHADRINYDESSAIS